MKDALLGLFLKTSNFCLYRNYKNERWSNTIRVEQPSLVFYDHACPLCRAEMQRLKSVDKYERLQLVDISSPQFDEEKWGVPRSTLSEALHVLLASGQWLVGMPAIRHVYRQVGWGWLMAPTGWPLISPLADIFYRNFAPNRNLISRWLGFHSQRVECSDDICGTDQQKRKGGGA
ncbi:thiol-disulfide oxidoreductase DCC family protein [Kaarinaea lacus]